jgi:hypothetical protein
MVYEIPVIIKIKSKFFFHLLFLAKSNEGLLFVVCSWNACPLIILLREIEHGKNLCNFGVSGIN